MSLATTGMMTSKWQNSAARRRCQAKFRAHVCRILQVPLDSCFTTAELISSARTSPALADYRARLGLRNGPAA